MMNMNRTGISRFPVAALQNALLEFAFRMRKENPLGLKGLVEICARGGVPGKELWSILEHQGLPFKTKEGVSPTQMLVFTEIMTRRITLNGEDIVIQDMVGSVCYDGNRRFQTRDEVLQEREKAPHFFSEQEPLYMLRTTTAAHPRALLPGDILECGEKILSHPQILQEHVDGRYFEEVLVHLEVPEKISVRCATWDAFPTNYVLALSHAVDPHR